MRSSGREWNGVSWASWGYRYLFLTKKHLTIAYECERDTRLRHESRLYLIELCRKRLLVDLDDQM